jgi:DNA-binding response OmpR family regulator
LVILNLRLPDRDGLAVLQDPRLESGRPFVILNTGTEQADELVGLDLDANDYVRKARRPLELAAWIRAVLRRARGRRCILGGVTPAVRGADLDNR